MRTATTPIERLQKQGIHRIGTPAQGFRYQGRAGRRVSRELEAHIRSLAIPPAWKDVVIAPSPRAKLQALGKDKAGRWRYRYSPQFTERQGTAKYERLVEFAQALPKLRRSIAQNIATQGAGPRPGDGVHAADSLHLLHPRRKPALRG